VVETLMISRSIVAAVVLLLVALAWVVVARRERRRHAGFEPRVARVPLAPLPRRPGAPLVAYYFTSRLCAECKETPRVVQEAAPEVPAVALSVHERADLAALVGVRETPTLLLVDEEGRIRYAREGNPTPAELWTYVREAWDSLDAEGRLVRVAASERR
jgi:glutaredoxin